MDVLKPAFLGTAMHYDQLGGHRKRYAALLAFVGLEPGDVFRKPELRLATRALPHAALERAAETLLGAIDGAGEQRADYWRNRAAPYLRSIWPKTHDAITEAVSENFVRASIAAGEAFPDAVEEIRGWVQPLRYPGHIAHALHEASLDTRCPEPALELLHRIVGDEASGTFHDLAACLSAIRTADPGREEDQRFQRLLEILRAHGEDLN